ncbi:MAG: hypothetical protein ACRDMJ_05470 [Solirubrobacteraceae bacterium]
MAALIAGCGSAAKPPPSPPSVMAPNRVGPETMFTVGGVSTLTPQTLDLLKHLGVDRIHIYMHWADIAPDPQSHHRPAFDATNPDAYPLSGWAKFDQPIREIVARHMTIDLDLVSPVPLWAQGHSVPRRFRSNPYWEPNATLYGQWVKAVGTRYSGHFTPPGQSTPLPRVSFWSIWNEPNLGIDLAPQTTAAGVEVSPRYYRTLVGAAWNGLHSTGHGGDTILIGELAPTGVTNPGNFGMMPGLRFLRALYCVNGSYKPLTGVQATERGCPATATASAAFAAANPGLFKASGVADHPYTFGPPPNELTPGEPDYTTLPAIPNLERTLDRLQKLYGSSTRFPIWSTEFGYLTNPPDGSSDTVSPQVAAAWINWAEYLTWQDPRIRSYDQYLLQDPPAPASANPFASGLQTSSGAPKPSFYAFRIPIFLPVTSAARGHPLVVWGCVRQAPPVAGRTHRRQQVQIQFSAGGGAAFKPVATVPIVSRRGYFEVHQTFSSSGEVRLAWKPPHGATEFSRTVSIKLR